MLILSSLPALLLDFSGFNDVCKSDPNLVITKEATFKCLIYIVGVVKDKGSSCPNGSSQSSEVKQRPRIAVKLNQVNGRGPAEDTEMRINPEAYVSMCVCVCECGEGHECTSDRRQWLS